MAADSDWDCEQSQWASLPEHILELFTDGLTSLHDLVRFSCVCNSWRSASPSVILRMNTIPWLIVPYQGYSNKAGITIWNDTLGFYSPFHGDDNYFKTKEKVFKVDLPEIADRRICGSSEGWLVTVHENSEMQLLDPISRSVVSLPPFTKLPDFVRTESTEESGLVYFVNEVSRHGTHLVDYDSAHFREFHFFKVVTNTSMPGTRDSTPGRRLPATVLAIHASHRTLAFYRPGIDEERWNALDKGTYLGLYHDVTFYKGNFYAASHAGHVVVVKGLDGPEPFTEVVKQEPDYEYYGDMIYLVESSGDLFMVLRNITGLGHEDKPYRTNGFKLLKLDFSGMRPNRVEVTCIEDCALFVGFNNSFSCSTSHFPGCKGNCIYFSDNCSGWCNPFGGHDMGVFNLEDGTFDTIYATATGSRLIMPPPVWFASTNPYSCQLEERSCS